jgi:hypothetical protein
VRFRGLWFVGRLRVWRARFHVFVSLIGVGIPDFADSFDGCIVRHWLKEFGEWWMWG